jgi:hypothetical protein
MVRRLLKSYSCAIRGKDDFWEGLNDDFDSFDDDLSLVFEGGNDVPAKRLGSSLKTSKKKLPIFLRKKISEAFLLSPKKRSGYRKHGTQSKHENEDQYSKLYGATTPANFMADPEGLRTTYSI